jgi:hypothetical protein
MGAPGLQQQGRERMAHLVWTAPMEFGGVENPIEHSPDVRFIERGAGDGREDPRR